MSRLFWPFNVLDRKLDAIIRNQDAILANQAQEIKIMSKISDAVAALTTQVEQNTAVENSAVTLIQGIAKQLSDALANAADDAAAVQAVGAITAQLNTDAGSLAAAVAANTPAAPPAPAAAPPVAGRRNA